MNLLVIGVARKNKSLVFVRASLKSTQVSLLAAQRDQEFMRLENAFLVQCLACIIVILGVVSRSFKNALQQVEHFHHPLCVSRKDIFLY